MKKSTIVLLHGALGSKSQLQSLKALLSPIYNIIDLDFEGHGAQPSDTEFTIDLFVTNVSQHLQNLNIEETNVFGYSMGGYVGLKLALQNPKLVKRIVTLGTKFNWTKEIAAQEIQKLNPQKIEAKVPAFAKSLNAIHPANNWKTVVTKTAALMSGLGNGMAMTDDDFRHINQEILIGIGDQDQMVSVDESSHVARLLPNGQLRILDGFKHPIEQVDTVQLADVVIDFLI